MTVSTTAPARRTLALLATGLLAAPAWSQCDPATGPIATATPATLQGLIDVAPANAFIFLQPGTYSSGIVIDDPAGNLTIFARQSATGVPNPNVQLASKLEIRNLDADEFVVLRGMDDDGNAFDHVVEDNEGAVWIESCSLRGASAGLEVRDSAAVTLVNCDLEGTAAGSAGLTVTSTGTITSVAHWGGAIHADSVSSGDGLVLTGAAAQLYADNAAITAGASGTPATVVDGALHHMGTTLVPAGIVLVGTGSAVDEGCLPRAVITQSAIKAGTPYDLNVMGNSEDDYQVYVGIDPLHQSFYSPSVPALGGGPLCGMVAFDFLGAPPVNQHPQAAAPPCHPVDNLVTGIGTKPLCDVGGRVFFGQSFFGGYAVDGSCAKVGSYVEAGVGAPTSVILYRLL